MGAGLIAVFVLWTVLVSVVDVRAIGPNGSSVGFATLNGYVHDLTGVNMRLYSITDWLGLVPIGVAFGFAVLGLVQWVGRKAYSKWIEVYSHSVDFTSLCWRCTFSLK